MNSKEMMALYEAQGGGTGEVEAALSHVSHLFLANNAEVLRSRHTLASKIAVLREADRTFASFIGKVKVKFNQPYLNDQGFRGMTKILSPDLHKLAFETTAVARPTN